MSTSQQTVPMHERVVAAATAFTIEHGWSALTMGRIAARVGVSRQTVYNELGDKSRLAEAMVMRELDSFLGAVDGAFRANPDDLVVAIREAARRTLEMAAHNPLLHAVLTSSQSAGSDLLPLLTTRAEPVLTAARQMIREHVTDYDVSLPAARVESLIDMVVRLVLSHVMQPAESPEETADGIAWIAGRVLQAAPDRVGRRSRSSRP